MNLIVHRLTRPLSKLAFIKVFKYITIILSLFLLSLVAAYYILPSWLTTKIPQIIEAQTGKKTTLGALQFSLSPLQISLHDFKIQESNNANIIAFENVTVQMNTVESFKQKSVVLDSFLLSKPFIYLSKQKDASFNISHLIKSPTKQEKNNDTNNPIIIKISKIALNNGQLLYSDSHIQQIIRPIDINISHFSTVENSHFDLGFSLLLDNLGQLNWQGTMSLNPLFSKGQLQLDKITLNALNELFNHESNSSQTKKTLQGTAQLIMDYEMHYKPKQLSFKTDNLKLQLQNIAYNQQINLAQLQYNSDFSLNYDGQKWQWQVDKLKLAGRDIALLQPIKTKLSAFNIELAHSGFYDVKQPLQFKIQHAKLEAQNAQLVDNDNKELIKLADLKLLGIDVNSQTKKISIDNASINNINVQAWLNADGLLNYQSLLVSNTKTNTPPENSNNESTSWQAQINHFSLSNSGLLFSDNRLKNSVSFNLKPLSLTLSNINTEKSAIMPVQFITSINKDSALNINGTIALQPFTTQLKLELKNFNLTSLQTYIDNYALLDLIDGDLQMNGDLFIAQNDTNTDIKFTGESDIGHFITRDKKEHKDLVTWANLKLSDINIDVAKQYYTASTLTLTKPYAKVTIRENKSLNFSDIPILQDTKKIVNEPKTIVKEDIKKPYFNLAKLELIDGASDFSDLSLILPFYAQIRALNGGTNSISSVQKSTIKAQLTGNAYDLAPVNITADLKPHLNEYDIKLNFKGMPMPLMSPYMVQFAGYKVENGKLFLDLNYNIANKKLTATNSIVIDQFELGDKVDNPKAASLPLELAVALLKDSNGKININVPITGSLEDPHFNISEVIADALMNAISKLVTSPFRLLANLIDSDADMSSIAFSAGNSRLDNIQIAKLNSLAKALQARPQLHINIKGTAFQNEDWPIIRHDALYDELKRILAAEIKQQSKRDILPEYVRISDEDYRRLLTQLFTEKFPLLAEKTLALKDASDMQLVHQFYALAEQKLAEIISPETQRLNSLAVARAQTIANYLVKQTGIASERVFILNTAIQEKADGELLSILSLKTQ